MNFSEMLKKVIVEDKERLAIEENNLRAKVEKIVSDALDDMGVTDGFTIDGPLVYFEEGIFLQAVVDTDIHMVDAWQIRGICNYCSLLCWSAPLHTLAEIAEVYNDFVPDPKHFIKAYGNDYCKKFGVAYQTPNVARRTAQKRE